MGKMLEMAWLLQLDLADWLKNYYPELTWFEAKTRLEQSSVLASDRA
jgi:hypothetical protein